MRRILFQRLLVFLVLILSFHFYSFSQSLTGIWKGYFVSDDGQNYKLEFQVDQEKNTAVQGVSYSYLDVRFYGKATMTGTFLKSSNTFRIREIRTVEVKSMLGGATCIMNYNFVYSKSGKEEFLEGTYLGKFETKDKTITASQWGDCGGGKVYLRKVTTSDFYVEPFLRNKIKTTPVLINQPPPKKDTAVVFKPKPKVPSTNHPVVVSKPPAKRPVVKNPVVKTNPPTNKPIVKNNLPVQKINTPVKVPIDTTQRIKQPVVKVDQPKPFIPTPNVLKERSNELVKTLVVNDLDVTVKLYDNGEIDGDTISVYFDKKLVLNAKGLTAAPLVIHLKMDDDNSDHELIMVAENLGRIPPNTSLMIVESGEQRFDVRITSTEQKNALVRFKYEKVK